MKAKNPQARKLAVENSQKNDGLRHNTGRQD
jgi:hypothetical protein